MGLLIGASVITLVEILDLVFYNCVRKGCCRGYVESSKSNGYIETIGPLELCIEHLQNMVIMKQH